MFDLQRNTFPVYFKNYVGKEEIIDEYGNRTGSYELIYGDLQIENLSLSPNKGTSESSMFGTLDDYDRTMTTANINCSIDEDSILWIDGADTSKPHNYIVKKRAPWKNSVSFATQKVKVSE